MLVGFMMFNATINKICLNQRHFQQYFSYMWRSVLFKPPFCRKSLTNFIIILYRVHIVWAGFELTTSVVIGTDCIYSCKSYYNTTTATTNPFLLCQ